MITLASDFGSPYPAAMKGVLLQRTNTRLVDITHDLPRQDVRSAAFWLRETLPYFPPATHLVVVDPGVGTDRSALVLQAGDHTLVGPDNGVLYPPARRLAGTEPIEAYVIDEQQLDAPTASTAAGRSGSGSNTFHGRDVFAPAAAAVHDATTPADLAILARAETTVDLRLPTPTVEGDRVHGAVLVVDDFGNVITNVAGSYLDGRETIVVNGDPVPVGATFAAVETGAQVAIVGSHGFVELDVNHGRGDEAFGLTAGDSVVFEPAESTE